MTEPRNVTATAELVNAFNVTGRGWVLGVILTSGTVQVGDKTEVTDGSSPPQVFSVLAIEFIDRPRAVEPSTLIGIVIGQERKRTFSWSTAMRLNFFRQSETDK